MPPYKQFKIRHPEYDADYWKKCQAFYSGGKTLLGDKDLMKEVFPQHNAEEDEVYQERIRRAFYIPYAGEIIDSLIAGLSSDPIVMKPGGANNDKTPLDTKSNGEKVDPYYDDFYIDCSPPGGKRCGFPELMKQQVLSALLKRRAWCLVELPERSRDDWAPGSLAEEEAKGYLAAYACTLDPAAVVDWEEDDSGELLWGLIQAVRRRRSGIGGDRNTVREEFTYYDSNTWTRYVFEYQDGKPPKDDQEPTETIDGTHTFKRVPLVSLELPEGLWAMGKIEGLAREHFNKRAALSWAEYKTLFPILASFLAGSDPMNPATEDPGRAFNNRYGPGRIAQFGEKDRLEYLTPNAEAFKAAMDDLAHIRDEMHRVLHMMAMTIDNSGAALQRSAQSKQIDLAATAIILGALGQFTRNHAENIYEMVEAGRGDSPAGWVANGMEAFDQQTLDHLLEEAQIISLLDIKSPRFQQIYQLMVAKRTLGDTATDEDLDTIQIELQKNITDEQFDEPTPREQFDATNAPPAPFPGK